MQLTLRSHTRAQAGLRYLVHPLHDKPTCWVFFSKIIFIAIQLEVVCKDTESQIVDFLAH